MEMLFNLHEYDKQKLLKGKTGNTGHVWIRHLITCRLLEAGTFSLTMRRGDLWSVSRPKHTLHVQHNSQKRSDEVVSNCPF